MFPYVYIENYTIFWYPCQYRKEAHTLKRNYGIDLLRITAMFFVAALHIIGIGGIITGSKLLSPQFLTAQFLRIAMLCAVNCYALISGFVGWDKKPKLSGLLFLWLQAVLFCLVATLFFSRNHDLDYKTWLNALLPVTTGQYWYLTAYVGLFVLMPILNLAVQKMPKRELTYTLGGILILFSLLPISPLTDAFYLHDGYSVLWLAVMYLLGGYLGKYDVLSRFDRWVWGLLYVVAVLFAWAPRMLVLWWRPHYWYDAYGNILIEYTSPTIVLAAVSLLATFSRLQISEGTGKVISRISGGAFGIYLAHAHPLVFRFLLENRFAHLGTANLPVLTGIVIAAAFVICLAGLLHNWVLTNCFLTPLLRLLRIDRLLKKLDTRF